MHLAARSIIAPSLGTKLLHFDTSWQGVCHVIVHVELALPSCCGHNHCAGLYLRLRIDKHVCNTVHGFFQTCKGWRAKILVTWMRMLMHARVERGWKVDSCFLDESITWHMYTCCLRVLHFQVFFTNRAWSCKIWMTSGMCVRYNSLQECVCGV